MLCVQELSFQHPGSSFRLAVRALDVQPGEPLAILGPSGGGKTTLLRLMAGLLPPDKGQISLGDTQLASLPAAQQRRFRLENIGLVFQDFALLDYLTAGENILLPSQFVPSAKAGSAHADRARQLADSLDIPSCWQRRAAHLSQGERQRVAIARALVHQPRYVFADEPTASLDAKRRGLVMDLLMNYARQNQACLVMVTHDAEVMPLFSKQARVEDFTS